ncbi:replication initiation factor [Listeria seeligeri]|uniref:replication initiation factor domain-containing protein n=1 Tax=Listeria seeligeri TaxID=1640 RepID=UPI0018882892|nr:replication initiation factor domain-containing protein [Listeria seeligeri]MBF2389852.1 replication initiation factor [Listeria seeligeri]
MSEAIKPTDTNRWVSTPKIKENSAECLTACIDWIQITVKAYTPEWICENLLQIPFDLMMEDEGTGIVGASAFLCFDKIRLLASRSKGEIAFYQILITGQACRQFELFLKNQKRSWFDFIRDCMHYDAHFTRIDLAIDDKKTYFKIDELLALAEKGLCQTKLKLGKKHGSFHFVNGESRGDTVDFGSRQSEFFMTFYEKNYEQANKYDTDVAHFGEWNRYELKFRQKQALLVASELALKKDVMSVVLPILNDKIRFLAERTNEKKERCPTWEPWAEFMKDVDKIRLTMKPAKKDYPSFYSWLQNAVAPSLWIAEQLREDFGEDIIQTVIDNAKITKKHQQMLAKYKQEYQLATGKLKGKMG